MQIRTGKSTLFTLKPEAEGGNQVFSCNVDISTQAQFIYLYHSLWVFRLCSKQDSTTMRSKPPIGFCLVDSSSVSDELVVPMGRPPKSRFYLLNLITDYFSCFTIYGSTLLCPYLFYLLWIKQILAP